MSGEPEPEPAVGSPQWQAQRLAQSLMRLSDAQDVVAAERAMAQARPVALVDSELRARMLAEARQGLGAVRMGRDQSGEALVVAGRLMSVSRDRDGNIQQMRPGASHRVVVVRPHEWEAHDRRWRARVQLEENLVLARYWGRDRCLMAGVISPDEARELPPDPPPGPHTAPYDVVNSVA